MIEGVKIIKRDKIVDERGMVLHMLRNDDEHFEQFGEIYYSVIFPDAIKAWHIHKKMTLNYAVIVGNIKLVLFDQREESSTYGELQEIYLGEDNYCLVKIPPLIVNGFKAIGNEKAIVANCATHPHDPDEIIRIDPLSGEIPYDWGLVHR